MLWKGQVSTNQRLWNCRTRLCLIKTFFQAILNSDWFNWIVCFQHSSSSVSWLSWFYTKIPTNSRSYLDWWWHACDLNAELNDHKPMKMPRSLPSWVLPSIYTLELLAHVAFFLSLVCCLDRGQQNSTASSCVVYLRIMRPHRALWHLVLKFCFPNLCAIQRLMLMLHALCMSFRMLRSEDITQT